MAEGTKFERAAAEELALLWGTFMLGRWAEVMASDDEPADDWQEDAAAEAVALFLPALQDMLAGVWDRGADSVCPDPDRCWCSDETHTPSHPRSRNPYRTHPTARTPAARDESEAGE